MSCNTSSNIKSGVSKLNATKEASRLIITISSDLSVSVGVGDVIRYDVENGYYVKSIASGIVESEVVGIVESINSDGSKNVVIYGSINLPSSNLLLITSDSTGASGGNDVFFLSSVYSGKLQNLAPTEGNAVIKSVYQIAPHGSYTGIVINNIGYALGGTNTNTFTSGLNSSDVGILNHYVAIGTNDDLPYHPYAIIPNNSSLTNRLLYLGNQSFYNKFDRKFGYIEECVFSPEFTIDSSINNNYIFDYDDTDSNANSQIISVNTETKTIEVLKNSGLSQLPITRTILEGYSYWIQQSKVYSGVRIGSVVTNAGAYNQTPVHFDTTSIKYLCLPNIVPYSPATVFIDIPGLINFKNTNINNISLRFIIKKESNTANVNINSYSFVNTLRVENLNINETSINDKLLELENRLSYLESRLSM